MSVYLSTGVFQTRDLEEVLHLCHTHRFSRIEFSSGLAHSPAASEKVFQANFLGPRLIHNYFPAPREPFVLNLAAADPNSLCRSLDLCQRAIDLSASMGAPFYSVHSGFVTTLEVDDLGRPDNQAGMDAVSETLYENAHSRFLESISFLARYARAKGVRLLLENNVVTPENVGRNETPQFLMATPDDFTRFFAELNDNQVGILLDTGHLQVSAQTLKFSFEDFFEAHSERIEAFHLSENDGRRDQNLPLSEDHPILSILPAYPGAAVVLEAYNLKPHQIEKQVDLIKRHRSAPEEVVV